VAEAFARLPALVGSRHVVDVGGGHGVLMIALQRRHPTLRGTVFWLRQV
jgi:16S rRNA G1207 methylase RsmC